MKKIFGITAVVFAALLMLCACSSAGTKGTSPSESFAAEAEGKWSCTEGEEGACFKMEVTFDGGRMKMETTFGDDKTKQTFLSQGYSEEEIENLLHEASNDSEYKVSAKDSDGVYTVEIAGSDSFVAFADGKLYMGPEREGFPENASLVLERE